MKESKKYRKPTVGRVLWTVFVILVLIGTFLIMAAVTPVHAGGGGQKATIKTPDGANIIYLYVLGSDQNNLRQEWRKDISPPTSEVSTDDYTWRGITSITLIREDGWGYHCNIDLKVHPKKEWSTIIVDKDRCLVRY